jgi:hypothetical protein
MNKVVNKINKKDVENIRLLTEDEYHKKSNVITKIEKDWWLRGRNMQGSDEWGTAVVDGDSVQINVAISDSDVGLRPVIVLRKRYDMGDKIRFIGVTWTVISNEYETVALCDDVLLCTYFDEESRDYNTSHIKDVIDAIYGVSSVIF